MHLGAFLLVALAALAHAEAVQPVPGDVASCINSGSQGRATSFKHYMEALPTRQGLQLRRIRHEAASVMA